MAGRDEFGSIVTSATKNLGVWVKDNVRSMSAMSDMKLDDLKREVATVYLTVPPEALEAYAPWMRVLVGQLIGAMTRVPGQPEHTVLFLLDEFQALGRMSGIEKSIGYIAGFGVSLWLVTQDLHQVAAVYSGERWKTLLANCTVKQAFGVSDSQTAELVSKMLGITTVHSRSEGHASALAEPFGRRNESHSETGRPLLTPGEIMTLDPDKILLFCDGWPILSQKLDYRTMKMFKGMWDNWAP